MSNLQVSDRVQISRPLISPQSFPGKSDRLHDRLIQRLLDVIAPETLIGSGSRQMSRLSLVFQAIYDLAKEPAQSKSDSEEIGVQVYPSVTDKRNEKAIDESGAHILASEALFWLDEDKLVFVDRAKRSNTLVVVDLRAGTDRAKVKAKALETSKLVKKCGESGDAPENLINVTGITLKKNVAHLNFQPVGKCLHSTTLDVPIE